MLRRHLNTNLPIDFQIKNISKTRGFMPILMYGVGLKMALLCIKSNKSELPLFSAVCLAEWQIL